MRQLNLPGIRNPSPYLVGIIEYLLWRIMAASEREGRRPENGHALGSKVFLVIGIDPAREYGLFKKKKKKMVVPERDIAAVGYCRK